MERKFVISSCCFQCNFCGCTLILWLHFSPVQWTDKTDCVYSLLHVWTIFLWESNSWGQWDFSEGNSTSCQTWWCDSIPRTNSCTLSCPPHVCNGTCGMWCNKLQIEKYFSEYLLASCLVNKISYSQT